MVAGLVWQLSNGSDLRQAAGYGVACGTAATLNPGTQLCRKEDADKIFEALEWA
jgi:6-phosphofructokinase 2